MGLHYRSELAILHSFTVLEVVGHCERSSHSYRYPLLVFIRPGGVEAYQAGSSSSTKHRSLWKEADMPNGWKGKLETIEGIGPAYAAELKKGGVESIASLLKRGATKKGREDIAQATGLPETRILAWVNRADLYRIKGVGGQYSDLLEQSGVDTVVELAQRNPKNLRETLLETNERCHLVHKVPTELQVKAWVKHAKILKRVVEY
jgi:predicted flap endonuclease-1-like 5' DNA nuclease